MFLSFQVLRLVLLPYGKISGHLQMQSSKILLHRTQKRLLSVFSLFSFLHTSNFLDLELILSLSRHPQSSQFTSSVDKRIFFPQVWQYCGILRIVCLFDKSDLGYFLENSILPSQQEHQLLVLHLLSQQEHQPLLVLHLVCQQEHQPLLVLHLVCQQEHQLLSLQVI